MRKISGYDKYGLPLHIDIWDDWTNFSHPYYLPRGTWMSALAMCTDGTKWEHHLGRVELLRSDTGEWSLNFKMVEFYPEEFLSMLLYKMVVKYYSSIKWSREHRRYNALQQRHEEIIRQRMAEEDKLIDVLEAERHRQWVDSGCPNSQPKIFTIRRIRSAAEVRDTFARIQFTRWPGYEQANDVTSLNKRLIPSQFQSWDESSFVPKLLIPNYQQEGER